MSEIENKFLRNKHAHLTIGELHVLYTKEILEPDIDIFDEEVFGFTNYVNNEGDCVGYLEDLRLLRRKGGEQQMKEDYARIYGCRVDQVTTSLGDLYNEDKNIVVFVGDVSLGLQEQKLPETLRNISGFFSTDSYYEEHIPEQLDYIGGSLFFNYVEGVWPKIPTYVGQHVQLWELVEIPEWGLEFSEYVGGHLNLWALTTVSSESCVFPKVVGGDFSSPKLSSVGGVVFPEYVGGKMNLTSLESIGEDQLPEYIGGDLMLDCLKSIDGVRFPEYVGGDVYLDDISKDERNKLRKQRPDLTIEPTP